MPPSSEAVESVRQLAGADHGLAVVATQRADGTVQCSVVNAGVLPHPVSGESVVAFVTVGGAVKLRHLRRTPRASVVFRASWQWIAVEGPASLAGPHDVLPGMDAARVPQLLRKIFTAAGGTHDDWEEFDPVMADEERTAVLFAMERVYPSRS